jgi:hypothetical protein
VISIVDRYLEHARVSYFENGGQAEYFLASADWMPRNLDRRVEIAFPVLDPDLQARIREILETYCKVGSGRSRFSTRSPAGLFEIEHQRQIGSPHGELEPSDTAQPIFREIILRAYERRLVGPVPPFPPEIETRIDRYLVQQGALKAARDTARPRSPDDDLTAGPDSTPAARTP